MGEFRSWNDVGVYAQMTTKNEKPKIVWKVGVDLSRDEIKRIRQETLADEIDFLEHLRNKLVIKSTDLVGYSIITKRIDELKQKLHNLQNNSLLETPNKKQNCSVEKEIKR